jgi:hypothetical protein
MKNFDLKKFITENKATFHSSLNEGYDEFKRAEKGSKGVTAKDKGEEEVYGAGVEKGEEIEKKELKNRRYYQDNDFDPDVDRLGDDPMNKQYYDRTFKESKLRSKIREMILAEMSLDIDNMEDAPESEVDFLSELENMLDEKELNPKSKEKEEDTEAAEDVTVDDTETIDTETTAEVDPNIEAIQDALTQAQAAAQKLGDEKLLNQIGNTITFFTRAHVVEKPGGALNESMFPILKKILK